MSAKSGAQCCERDHCCASKVRGGEGAAIRELPRCAWRGDADSVKVLTDLLVYDWWALILGFAGEDDAENHSEKRIDSQIKWVGELMEEYKVKALPRPMEQLDASRLVCRCKAPLLRAEASCKRLTM